MLIYMLLLPLCPKFQLDSYLGLSFVTNFKPLHTLSRRHIQENMVSFKSQLNFSIICVTFLFALSWMELLPNKLNLFHHLLHKRPNNLLLPTSSQQRGMYAFYHTLPQTMPSECFLDSSYCRQIPIYMKPSQTPSRSKK